MSQKNGVHRRPLIGGQTLEQVEQLRAALQAFYAGSVEFGPVQARRRGRLLYRHVFFKGGENGKVSTD